MPPETAQATRPTALHARPPVRVVVVARMRLLREGLADALDAAPDLMVVGVAGSAVAGRALAAGGPPPVGVVEIGTLDGPAPAGDPLAGWPGPVVVVGCPERMDDLVAIIEAGAAGFVTVDQPIEDLLEAILHAGRGEMVCPPPVAAALARRLAALGAGRGPGAPRVGSLTPREREIALLLEEGLTNREIARRLVVEVPTVKGHVQNILRKLEVRRRGEAAAMIRTVL